LYVPLFWNLIKKKTLALFTNSLWMLLSKWVIINKALEISSRALENSYYEKKMIEIIKWINKWENLSSLMGINEIKTWKANFYFPIELSSVVKIWEQTWRLPELLEKIGKKFNKEIDNITKNLSTAIEPVVIIMVWIIVWTLIMAIMLPFFNMVNVV
jgi:type IV pilus assembly protein PilC